jgi:hypothetical protein
MNTNTRSWSRGTCARKAATECATKRKPAVLRSCPALGAAKPWPNTSVEATPNNVAHRPPRGAAHFPLVSRRAPLPGAPHLKR